MASGQNAVVALVNGLENGKLFKSPGTEGTIAREKKSKQSHALPIIAVRRESFDRYSL